GRRMAAALGWIVLAFAGVGDAPRVERENAAIGYTVRFVETEGLGWRESVFTRLTPVTRQGSATIWTAPRDGKQRLGTPATKPPTAHILAAPKVTARPGAPAHVSTRTNRQLVTQVAWTGDDRPAEVKPETLRSGLAATVAGRKIDQGI